MATQTFRQGSYIFSEEENSFACQLLSEDMRSALTQVDATQLLHASLDVREEGSTKEHTWKRPLRFSAIQLRALANVNAWHPGLFKQMAYCTSGIFLEFKTDAEICALEIICDAEPRATAASLGLIDGDVREVHDAISVDFDGVHRMLPVSLDELCEEYSKQAGKEEALLKNHLVVFSRSQAQEGEDPEQLPGLAAPHHVRVWLPALRGCRIAQLYVSGSIIEPIAKRPHILCVGDSITQGFVADDPASIWTSLLGNALGCDVLNQGIGGQVFQVGTLQGFPASLEFEHVVVAFGANYRYESCDTETTARTIRSYMSEMTQLMGNVPTWVITPFGSFEGPFISDEHSCYQELVDMLSDASARHPQMRICIGTGLLPARKRLLADGFEHPNQEGHASIARRLQTTIERSAEVVRKRANPTKRQYARDEKTGRFVVSAARANPLDLAEDTSS